MNRVPPPRFPQLSGTPSQAIWLSSGLACGVASWCLGASVWPPALLRALSGVSVFSESVLILVLVAYVASNLPWRHRAWAANDFENFSPFACRFLHRATLVFVGVSLVAAAAWLSGAETSAAVTAVAGALLSAQFFLYSVLLARLAQQKRRTTSDA